MYFGCNQFSMTLIFSSIGLFDTNVIGIFLFQCVYQHHPSIYSKAHNELGCLCLYCTGPGCSKG